ncbi:hypothetical protein SDC9_186634 [bioreactor metagenome]|uniref:Uncharacterized protein n=1 Tax=bioreactor metagenome TaxID=1076179 RepID=A0A645HJB9_9ZZZZ
MDAIDFIDIVQQAGVHDALGACRGHFFGMLVHNFDCSFPLVPQTDQAISQDHQIGSVPIMSAGMHDTWVFGCKRQTGLFFDLKRIKIRPQRDGPAWLFSVDRDDDAIAVPDVRLHINRFILIETGDERSRFFLVE